MCLEFASCFGGGGMDDYGGERPTRKEEHGGSRHRRDRTGNLGSAYNGTDHHQSASAYHNHPPTAIDEAGHKACHDGAGGCGRYATYAQHKAHIETPKLPAWHKVGDKAYTVGFQEAVDADHRNNAAVDYYHYPTSTTTTTLGRY